MKTDHSEIQPVNTIDTHMDTNHVSSKNSKKSYPFQSFRFDLRPAILDYIKNYNISTAYSDFSSALVVASTSLPLLMAYAISSNLRPEIGLYCAFASGLIAALLTGSRYQMTSPAAGFHMFVIATMSEHGVDGLFTCMVLTGIILIALGFLGMGAIIDYIPRTIILAMTNGIGAMLVVGELTRFFGVQIPSHISAKNIPEKAYAFCQYFHTFSIETTLLSLAVFLSMFFLKNRMKKIPLGVIITLGGTFFASFFKLNVITIGSCYPGGIPIGFPDLFPGSFNYSLIPVLFQKSFTIAMLVAFKSMLSAVVGDKMGESKHNPNMELIAQGGGNIASAFMGGMPCTGSIGRTASNIGNGGKTPFAAVFQSLIIFSIVLVFAPVANHIPLCVLSGIMFYVVYSVGEWHLIPEMMKLSKSDIAVWIITFLCCVFKNLETAMQAGILLSGILYIQKVSSSTKINLWNNNHYQDHVSHLLPLEIPKDTHIYEISGPMMFGTSSKLQKISHNIQDDHNTKTIILYLKNMTAIDSTAIDAFKDLLKELKAKKKHLFICGLSGQTYDMFIKAGFNDILGNENIYKDLQSAINNTKSSQFKLK